jgi:hypothetical protein
MVEPGGRPAALQWALVQAAVLVAAACVVLALGWLPELGLRAGWLAGLAGLLCAVAVLRWPLGPPETRQAMARPEVLALGLALAVGFALRAWPAWSSDVPLGYDYGFYKAAFDAYSGGDLPLRSQPAWMASQFEPGLPALHGVLHGVAGLSSHDHLRYLHPALAAACALFVFVAARAYAGTQAGLLAAALTAVSSLQLEAHAYLYEKNLVALGLLAVALFLLQRRAWLSCGLLLGAVGAWHRPTLLLAAVGLPIAVLLDPRLRAAWRGWASTAALAAALIVPVWLAMPDTFLSTGLSVAQESVRSVATGTAAGTGTFYSTESGLRRMAPYLPLALAATAAAWRWPNLRAPVLVLMMASAYIGLELPLHRRFLLMADALAILVAGAALTPLVGSRAIAVGAACVVLAAGLASATIAEPTTPHRFLTEPQWAELSWLQTLPANATLVADNLRSPYVLAESGRLTYGPGLFDDVHERAEWQRFWAGLEGEPLREFMAPYGEPVYMVQADDPGPDWGSASLHEPGFGLVHQGGGLRVWQYQGGDA